MLSYKKLDSLEENIFLNLKRKTVFQKNDFISMGSKFQWSFNIFEE